MKSIAFTSGSFTSRASGLVTLIEGFSNALSAYDSLVKVYVPNCERGFSSLSISPPAELYTPTGKWIRKLNYSPQLRSQLIADAANIDIFHNHSVWCLPAAYACSVARMHKKPHIFSSHGALEPWSMSRNSIRKAIIWGLFQRKDLHSARCIHTSSLSENHNLRRLGIRVPLATIPNGVEIPALPSNRRQRLDEILPSLANRKKMLFLGRLHEKKGVRNLLLAWARLSTNNPDWALLLAGPDDGFEHTARLMIEELQLQQSVHFTGVLYDNIKSDVLFGSDAFVLPSFAEGFSLAVLEAMAHGLPVLLSEQCNFREVVSDGCGFVTSTALDDVHHGMVQMMGLTSVEREQMGARGRDFVKLRYSWALAASRMNQLYSWILGGNRPQDVEIDFCDGKR